MKATISDELGSASKRTRKTRHRNFAGIGYVWVSAVGKIPSEEELI
jgi:hypothetical protein